MSIDQLLSRTLTSKLQTTKSTHAALPADNERTLCVACDTSVISTVVHRLAAASSLAVISRPEPFPSPRLLPGISSPQDHPSVLLLSDLASRHLRLGPDQMCRLISLEPEKWKFLVSSVKKQGGGGGDVSRAPSRVHSHAQAGAESAEGVAGWLDDVAGARGRLGGLLKGDNWGVRLVLGGVGAGLCSTDRGVVLAACRAVCAVCGEMESEEAWRWLVGGREAGGDGLQWLVEAHGRHDRDVQLCKAVADVLCAVCRPERVGHILTVELPLRVSGRDGGFSIFVADTCGSFAANPRVRRELEWHGLVPFLVNFALRELHVSPSDDARAAALDMMIEVTTLLPRA